MLLGWLVATAWAQEPAIPDLNAQLYRAPVDAQRTLWTEAAVPIEPDFQALPRLVMHYTWRPLVYLPEEGDPVRLVSDVLQADGGTRTAAITGAAGHQLTA